MMMLVTRPEHDPTTKYLSCWGQEYIDDAEKRHVPIVDRRYGGATRVEVESRIQKLHPSLVVLNGHGNRTYVTGHNNEVLVETKNNSDLLSGRITYAVSCSSAAELGTEVGMHAASTYVGYTEKFVFVHSSRFHDPLSDAFARPCMEPSNHVVLSLLKGHTAGEAVSRSKEKSRQHLRHLMSSASDPDARMVAQWVWWNAKHLVCCGDENKTM